MRKDKWKLYLYYNGILIKKLNIDKDEAPAEKSYVIRVLFKKQLFGSNFVEIIVRPTVLLKNDDSKRRTYWGVIFEQGIQI